MSAIVEKDNVRLAEFMGWNSYVSDGDIQLYKKGDDIKHLKELDFDNSWELLMELVLEIEGVGASVIIGRFFCEIKYINPLNESQCFDIRIASGIKKNAINGAATEFCRWWKINKK